MKKITEFNSRSLRRERNADVLRRMRNGDQLASFNSNASWFPPRPIIQKDAFAIQALYGNEETAMHGHHAEAHGSAGNLADLSPLRLA